jgi:uncharacterized repeat protein (TIGR03803 family)
MTKTEAIMHIRRLIAGATLAFAGWMVGTTVAAAAQPGLTIFHSFCSDTNCTDGSLPQARLIRDQDGNLYGTTLEGGEHGSGTIFEVTSTGVFNTLYSFCSLANCADGSVPMGALIVDGDGNLYGVTNQGGSNRAGTVFEFEQSTETLITVYNFCTQTNCLDGSAPTSGLTYVGAAGGKLYDETSPLFGTTQFGGNSPNKANSGVAYQLTLNSGQWSESVIYNFCSILGFTGCLDGYQPTYPLAANAKGDLFGDTLSGGKAGSGERTFSAGVIFELRQATGKWRQTVLSDLCLAGVKQKCKDGAEPSTGMALSKAGRLYGFTVYGGTDKCQPIAPFCGHGVIFTIVPPGGSNYQALYDICRDSATCPDGTTPADAPTIDGRGSIAGTMEDGGDATNWTGGGGSSSRSPAPLSAWFTPSATK